MPGPVIADAINTLLGLAELPNTVLTARVASEYLREFQADPDSVMLDVATIRRALPAMVSVALERSLRAVERVP